MRIMRWVTVQVLAVLVFAFATAGGVNAWTCSVNMTGGSAYQQYESPEASVKCVGSATEQKAGNFILYVDQVLENGSFEGTRPTYMIPDTAYTPC